MFNWEKYATHLVIVLFLSVLYIEVPAQEAVFASYTTSSEQDVPKSLSRKFRRDAARLALRLEAQNEDLRFQNIEIPNRQVDNFYNILVGIYTQDETAKSIADCNIHTFPSPSIDHLIIIFDKNIDWAAPLHQGITETDNIEINELMEDYDLIIEKHIQWNDQHDAITIRSAEPLNMAALANEFYNVEGVESIDFGLPKVGGNDIKINRMMNGWEVTYILKFGSYISGDGKSHTWQYHALDDGTIKFIEEAGEPVPAWMRCENLSDALISRL